MSNARYKKWSHGLERIENEQIRDLLVSRHIFQHLQECLLPHVGTYRGADLSEWMVQNYVAFASTAIRRMIERPRKHPDRKWRSISLVILLEDLAANDVVLTRERYCKLYKNPKTSGHADSHFNTISRNKKASHVTAARIRRDIKAIEVACAPVERLVNKVVAHTETDRRKVGKVKFGEINNAIEVLEEIFQRYSLLINGRVCRPTVPFDSINVKLDLKKIWP